MEIISNCAQRFPASTPQKGWYRVLLMARWWSRRQTSSALKKITSAPKTTGSGRTHSHTRTRRQAPPGTPFWTRSQQARSSRRASRSWPRRGTRRMSSISRRRMRGSNRRAFSDRAGAPSVRTLQRTSRSCLRVPRADALKVALLGPFDVLNGHASDPRHAGRGETHLQGVEGSESPCRARPGGHSTFGWVKESPNGSPVRACMHADLQAVLPIYWKSVASGVTQK